MAMTIARELAYQEIYVSGKEKPFQYCIAKNQTDLVEVLHALWQSFRNQSQDKSSYILLQSNDHQALIKINFKPLHFSYDDLSGRPILSSEKAVLLKFAHEIKAQGGTVDMEHCLYDYYEKRKKALIAATLGEGNFPHSHHSLTDAFLLLEEREKAPSIVKHGFFSSNTNHVNSKKSEITFSTQERSGPSKEYFGPQNNNKPTTK